MSSIFETVKLSKSDDPFIIPKNILNLDSFEFDGLEGKTNLREMLDSSYTDAFVILKDNNIIFEEYQNEMKELLDLDNLTVSNIELIFLKLHLLFGGFSQLVLFMLFIS